MKNIQNNTNANIQTNASINAAANVNLAFPTITPGTTLGDLIAALRLGEKPHDMPTPKALRETAGDPVAAAEGILVYGNGYAVYDNGSGRTVIWLPDCLSFTYYFNPMKDSEIGGEIKQTCELPDGLLASEPWPIAVTLIGDHRVENNIMNRMGSRTGTKDYDADDNGDKDGDAEDAVEKAYRTEYTWTEGRFGEDPLEHVLREERRREMLEAMTDKQREVFILYYQEGYNQYEIADMLGISQKGVAYRLEGAVKKVRKNF